MAILTAIDSNDSVIGDIKQSLGKPGVNWLQCNGADYDTEMYPNFRYGFKGTQIEEFTGFDPTPSGGLDRGTYVCGDKIVHLYIGTVSTTKYWYIQAYDLKTRTMGNVKRAFTPTGHSTSLYGDSAGSRIGVKLGDTYYMFNSFHTGEYAIKYTCIYTKDFNTFKEVIISEQSGADSLNYRNHGFVLDWYYEDGVANFFITARKLTSSYYNRLFLFYCDGDKAGVKTLYDYSGSSGSRNWERISSFNIAIDPVTNKKYFIEYADIKEITGNGSTMTLTGIYWQGNRNEGDKKSVSFVYDGKLYSYSNNGAGLAINVFADLSDVERTYKYETTGVEFKMKETSRNVTLPYYYDDCIIKSLGGSDGGFLKFDFETKSFSILESVNGMPGSESYSEQEKIFYIDNKTYNLAVPKLTTDFTYIKMR